MAKVPAKKTAKATAEAPAAKKPAAKKAVASVAPIEKASVSALAKLKELQLDSQLQADLEWCLGSYHHDHNPVGLYEAGDRALQLFKEAQIKKTKGITAKFIADLEKALAR